MERIADEPTGVNPDNEARSDDFGLSSRLIRSSKLVI